MLNLWFDLVNHRAKLLIEYLSLFSLLNFFLNYVFHSLFLKALKLLLQLIQEETRSINYSMRVYIIHDLEIAFRLNLFRHYIFYRIQHIFPTVT